MYLSEAEMNKLLVIHQVKNRTLTQADAAKQLNLSTRQIRRLQVRYDKEGAVGIKSRNKGGNRLISSDFKHKVMTAVRARYHDFGPTFAAEKLELEGLKVSKETLRKWMISERLWKGRTRKQARIHQCRERRPRFGELIQIDGSAHDWFEGRAPKCCLLVFIDDATSKILGLRFEDSETTVGYMRLIKETVEVYGRPLAYYNDKHAIFKTTRDVDNRFEDTQLGRALRSLQIEDICAHSPQAKGRVERSNQTLQDRMVKEMRLKGISSMEEANAYVPEFIADYNRRFSVEAANNEDAHRKLHHDQKSLKRILSIHSTRKLTKNLEFSYACKKYQIKTPGVGYGLRYKAVTVVDHVDGTKEVLCDNKPLLFEVTDIKKVLMMADTKDINLLMDSVVTNLIRIDELPTGFTSPSPTLAMLREGCELVYNSSAILATSGHF